MAVFEITLQSAYGFVGPFDIKADSADDALLVARATARAVLSTHEAAKGLDNPWLLIVRSEDGEVLVTVPFYANGSRSARRDDP